MAKSKGNVVTFGLSGKIGDLLVFRQRNGQTIVAKLAERPKHASGKQTAHRKRFQQATVYAQAVVKDPQLKELYDAAAKKRKGVTAYNIAVADFFNAPDIETLDLSAYKGEVGDEIRITVSDDFAVKEVHVSISNADGSVVEEGYASHISGNLWTYVATQYNESLDGDRIEISASDIPGNITSEERSL
ncbi:MAG: hypothetical protein LBH60_02755 [Prevotellaceae bacterium]|jgi:hypothetical protein|nr:hypothetical protein [Prevotellaceae bacterium]